MTKINRGIYKYTRKGKTFTIEFCKGEGGYGDCWNLFEDFPGTTPREWINDFPTKRDAKAYLVTMREWNG